MQSSRSKWNVHREDIFFSHDSEKREARACASIVGKFEWKFEKEELFFLFIEARLIDVCLVLALIANISSFLLNKSEFFCLIDEKVEKRILKFSH